MDTGANPLPVTPGPAPSRWRSAWPDALAFAAGLAMAWGLDWKVRDLVWSLWLSSLLVGYAMIVWTIFRPAVAAWLDAEADGASPLTRTAVSAAYWIGGLFLLAFFTFHFGMFHFVHSVFLNLFFPAIDTANRGFPTASLYLHVLGTYWPFVLVAAVAERGAFRMPAADSDGAGLKMGDGMMAPYKNVVRMHLMIFFFAFTSFIRLENFYLYATVYAVYFFPWRLLRQTPPAAAE